MPIVKLVMPGNPLNNGAKTIPIQASLVATKVNRLKQNE
jgi:hypothetical protein